MKKGRHILYAIPAGEFAVSSSRDMDSPTVMEFEFRTEKYCGGRNIIANGDLHLRAWVTPLGLVGVADICLGPLDPLTENLMRAYFMEVLLDDKGRVAAGRTLGFLMEYSNFPHFLRNLLTNSTFIVRGQYRDSKRLLLADVQADFKPNTVSQFIEPKRPY